MLPSPFPRLPNLSLLLPFLHRALEPNRPHRQLPVRFRYPPEVATGEVREHRVPLQTEPLSQRGGVQHVVTVGCGDPIYVCLPNHSLQHTEITYQDAEGVDDLLTNTENTDTLVVVGRRDGPGGAGNIPRLGPQGVGPTGTTSVTYVLCRIEDDSSLTPVSEHED